MKIMLPGHSPSKICLPTCIRKWWERDKLLFVKFGLKEILQLRLVRIKSRQETQFQMTQLSQLGTMELFQLIRVLQLNE